MIHELVLCAGLAIAGCSGILAYRKHARLMSDVRTLERLAAECGAMAPRKALLRLLRLPPGHPAAVPEGERRATVRMILLLDLMRRNQRGLLRRLGVPDGHVAAMPDTGRTP
jgi:hypothetical protein